MIESIYDSFFRNFRTKALRILPKDERPIFREYYDKWEASLDWDGKSRVGKDFQKMSIEQFPMTVAFMLNGFKEKMRRDTIKLAIEADKELEDAKVGCSTDDSRSDG